jgi:hypothetical protein
MSPLEGRRFVLLSLQYLPRSDFPEALRNALGGETMRLPPRISTARAHHRQVLAGPMWEQEGVLAAELGHQRDNTRADGLRRDPLRPAGRFPPARRRASGRQ